MGERGIDKDIKYYLHNWSLCYEGILNTGTSNHHQMMIWCACKYLSDHGIYQTLGGGKGCECGPNFLIVCIHISSSSFWLLPICIVLVVIKTLDSGKAKVVSRSQTLFWRESGYARLRLGWGHFADSFNINSVVPLCAGEIVKNVLKYKTCIPIMHRSHSFQTHHVIGRCNG